jgi:hypothetical protein
VESDLLPSPRLPHENFHTPRAALRKRRQTLPDSLDLSVFAPAATDTVIVSAPTVALSRKRRHSLPKLFEASALSPTHEPTAASLQAAPAPPAVPNPPDFSPKPMMYRRRMSLPGKKPLPGKFPEPALDSNLPSRKVGQPRSSARVSSEARQGSFSSSHSNAGLSRSDDDQGHVAGPEMNSASQPQEEELVDISNELCKCTSGSTMGPLDANIGGTKYTCGISSQSQSSSSVAAAGGSVLVLDHDQNEVGEKCEGLDLPSTSLGDVIMSPSAPSSWFRTMSFSFQRNRPRRLTPPTPLSHTCQKQVSSVVHEDSHSPAMQHDCSWLPMVDSKHEGSAP